MVSFFEKGGIVMWPLLILSFISLTVIFERILFFWKESLRHKPREIQNLLSSLKKKDYKQVSQVASKAKDDYIVRTLINGLVHHEQSLSRALEVQALHEMRRLKSNMSILDTVITAAPLLGILGTVIGIISSFDVLGTQGISDPVAVTKGISEALITTAYGLTIALATLIPYNFFRHRYRKYTEELEYICSQLEIIIENNPPEDSALREALKNEIS